MGSSIAMIDYHYGHLTRDSREHAVSLLDALAIDRADAKSSATLEGGGRSVDAKTRHRRQSRKQKELILQNLREAL